MDSGLIIADSSRSLHYAYNMSVEGGDSLIEVTFQKEVPETNMGFLY